MLMVCITDFYNLEANCELSVDLEDVENAKLPIVQCMNGAVVMWRSGGL